MAESLNSTLSSVMALDLDLPKKVKGLKFKPSDEILLHYLYDKIHGIPYFPNVVFDRDLYSSVEPWQIWESLNGVDDEDRFVFTQLKRSTNKSGQFSCHVNRKVGSAGGTWSGENSLTPVTNKDDDVIGYSRRLRYENPQMPEHHGGWIMHEYNLHESFIRDDCLDPNYVLCRIRKNERIKRKEELQSNGRCTKRAKNIGSFTSLARAPSFEKNFVAMTYEQNCAALPQSFVALLSEPEITNEQREPKVGNFSEMPSVQQEPEVHKFCEMTTEQHECEVLNLFDMTSKQQECEVANLIEMPSEQREPEVGNFSEMTNEQQKHEVVNFIDLTGEQQESEIAEFSEMPNEQREYEVDNFGEMNNEQGDNWNCMDEDDFLYINELIEQVFKTRSCEEIFMALSCEEIFKALSCEENDVASKQSFEALLSELEMTNDHCEPEVANVIEMPSEQREPEVLNLSEMTNDHCEPEVANVIEMPSEQREPEVLNLSEMTNEQRDHEVTYHFDDMVDEQRTLIEIVNSSEMNKDNSISDQGDLWNFKLSEDLQLLSY